MEELPSDIVKPFIGLLWGLRRHFFLLPFLVRFDEWFGVAFEVWVKPYLCRVGRELRVGEDIDETTVREFSSSGGYILNLEPSLFDLSL